MSSSASAPLSASATTSISPLEVKARTTPSRNIGWSSPTTTRTLSAMRHSMAQRGPVISAFRVGGMHLDELQWFVVLAETEHVTDAAAELGISQPTLSRALARLEEQVGVPLFDRVNRRLRLNAYGHILLEHARRSISEIRTATDRIAELRD